ncbi:MAG TPA: transglycosylase domain-containing protein, partial [Egibacteraceae bacterium]|nr:transglycosylase domain-containing protein [Egibacteraceae bacterium]
MWRRLALLATTLLAVTLALALGAATVVPALARSVAAMSGLKVTMPTAADLSLAALEERSVVYAADGSVLAVLHDEVDRRIVPLEEIPEHVRDAVITAEDQKFWEHGGYDVEGIARAAIANAKARDVLQGGSTITQQLAKSLVGNQRTLERKLSELTYAVALESRYTKEELLERYLNQVYLGAGAYGVAAAAEEYFHKQPSELTPAEGAMLAAVIRSPSRLDPRRNGARVKVRRDAVLRAMAGNGLLHGAEAQAALSSPLGVLPHRPSEVREPYFVEAMKREFFANPAFGATREERINLLFSGGLQIQTTLRPELQAAAEEVIGQFFPEPGGPTAAIATVDPRDGRVLALASGVKFTEEQFDLAAQGRRQPGSSFKPFVLAAALEYGFPLDMRLRGDGPISIDMPGAQEDWEVDNYAGSSYGDLDLRSALTRSVNTAFAQLVMLVGPAAAADVAERLGINVTAALGGLPPYPAIALGGLQVGVTPLEMASAYGTLAVAGQRVAPRVIERVTNRAGDVLWQARPRPETVIEPAVAGTMIDVMQDVVRRGTGTAARIRGWEPAGKTGTTQNNADAWFIGTVPVMSTAVWVGHPDAQIPMRGVTGGSLTARIWQRFMAQALEGVEPVPFPETPPLSSVLGKGNTQIPDVVGMEATEALRTLARAGLVGTVRSVDTTRTPGSVLWQSPRDGRTARRGSTVT